MIWAAFGVFVWLWLAVIVAGCVMAVVTWRRGGPEYQRASMFVKGTGIMLAVGLVLYAASSR